MEKFIIFYIFIVFLNAIVARNVVIIFYHFIVVTTLSLFYILFDKYILSNDNYSEFIAPLSIFIGIVFIGYSISEHIKIETWKKRFNHDGYADNQREINSFLTQIINEKKDNKNHK